MSILSDLLEKTLKTIQEPQKDSVPDSGKHDELIIRKTSLYYDLGTSDKVYHVIIRRDVYLVQDNSEPPDTFSVVVEWGRRESKLQTMTKFRSLSRPRALHRYNAIVQEKVSKGYKISSTHPEMNVFSLERLRIL